jgi:hypothetical protein
MGKNIVLSMTHRRHLLSKLQGKKIAQTLDTVSIIIISQSEKMSMGNVYIKRRLPMKMNKNVNKLVGVFFVNKFNDALPNDFQTT